MTFNADIRPQIHKAFKDNGLSVASFVVMNSFDYFHFYKYISGNFKFWSPLHAEYRNAIINMTGFDPDKERKTW